MKQLLTIISVAGLFLFFTQNLGSCSGNLATKDDLKQTEQRLKKEIVLNRKHLIIVERKIDTLQKDVTALKANQDTIKLQLYQLQNGQIVIYQAIEDYNDNDSKSEFLKHLEKFLGYE